MAQELNYIVVQANTMQELEKKVNDRIAFGYQTSSSLVVTENTQGVSFYQTMIKK
jgi:hypothetical protein